MKRFLIFVDLDSTFLTDDKQISKKTIKYTRKLVKKGHILSICSGRPRQGCMRYYNTLGVDCPLVTENGSNIYFSNPAYNKSFLIPLDDFKSFLKDIDDIIVSAFTGTRSTLLVQNKDKVPFWIIHEDSSLKRIDGRILDNITEEPHLPSIITNDYDKTIEVLKKYPSIAYRCWGQNEDGYTFELFSSLASKGNALRYLKDYYQIDDECTIAFGDQLNDSSMIKEAFYGVCMINGVLELKKIANVITKKDNNHNGVATEIKRILKLQKAKEKAERKKNHN